jgi:hypothetical protein
MSNDFENDILQAVADSALDNESYYAEKWKKWVTIRELPGNERSDLFKKSRDKKGKEYEFNQKKFYGLVTIMSTRFPDAKYPPPREHPHYKEFPGATDEEGKLITPPHPGAGQLCFTTGHMGMLLEKSGSVLERIGQVASRLSLLDPSDIEEKKGNSESEEDSTESEDSTTE